MSTNQIEKKTEGGLGASNTKLLSQMFVATANVYYDAKAAYKELLKGIKNYNPSLGAFDMDYGKSPKITDFVPNPTSPGPGDVNPNNKPPAPQGFPGEPSGWASLASPSETAPAIASQEFDKLTPGKSS